MTGGTVRTTNVFDFPGRVLYSKRTYVVNAVSNYVRETFSYDHMSRVTSVKHSINGAADVMITQNNYNELGQLVDKQLHSTDNGATFKQSVDHRYNIRGWLTKINESDVSALAGGETLQDYFGMELGYQNTLNNVAASAQFNGNISAMKWSSGANGGAKKQGYGYQYDPMNRLVNSYHNQSNALTGWVADISNQETGFNYDLNGNIKALTRKGMLATDMDILGYNYTGNQLNYVHDTGDAAKGFINGNTGTDDYLYDANGSMTQDKNKGITAITYNYLNLPQQVNKGATDYIVYTYDATGRKLSQQVFGGSPKTTDYIGEMIYENNALQFINTSEGRVLPDGAAWEYQYHLKDHLGNVRVTFTTKAQTTTTSTADFEAASNGAFTNYNRTGFDLVDHTDAGATKTYVQWLQSGNRVGIAKSMAVMPGDQVTISAWAKYRNLSTTNPNAAPLITTLASAFGVGAGSTGDQLKLYNGLNYYAGTVTSGNHDTWATDDETPPKLFVTILFFDKEYNFVDAAWDQVGTAGLQTSATVKEPPHDLLSKTASAPVAGFAYVFVSNEHPYSVDAYFDDVTVSHTPSQIVSSSDYYAFGLAFNSYSRESSIPNDYKYNGKEEQTELGLSWLDYGARMYDPAIARWMAIDPMADAMRRHRPYNYAFDNPLRYIDPDGMSPGLALENSLDIGFAKEYISSEEEPNEGKKENQKKVSADGKTGKNWGAQKGTYKLP